MDRQRKLMELEGAESKTQDVLDNILREAREKELHTVLDLGESIRLRHVVEISNHRQAIKSLLIDRIREGSDHKLNPEMLELVRRVHQAIEAFEEASQKLKEFKQDSSAA